MKFTPPAMLPDLPHVTPVPCPGCNSGKAHLTRRGPDPFKRDGKTEIWVFECDDCKQQFRQTVDN